ncbi:MAG: twin-arginine translocase TatA/TatE family subunit [Anaeromyxobacteraceae bacterium]
MRLGFGEILLILAVALLIFGPTKLPQLGEALGKGIRNFKKSTEADDEPPAQPKAQPPSELPAQAQGQGVPASKQTVTAEHKQS